MREEGVSFGGNSKTYAGLPSKTAIFSFLTVRVSDQKKKKKVTGEATTVSQMETKQKPKQGWVEGVLGLGMWPWERGEGKKRRELPEKWCRTSLPSSLLPHLREWCTRGKTPAPHTVGVFTEYGQEHLCRRWQWFTPAICCSRGRCQAHLLAGEGYSPEQINCKLLHHSASRWHHLSFVVKCIYSSFISLMKLPAWWRKEQESFF